MTSKNNNVQKKSNNNSKVVHNNKINKDIPLGEKYIKINQKENFSNLNNSEKYFFKKYVIKYDKSCLTNPTYKLKNKMKPFIISPYNTKKYIKPKGIFPGKKNNNGNLSDLRNAILNINDNSLNSSRFNKIDSKNMIFKTYSSRKDNKMKRRFLDKDSLRKGVTTVIQHYCGISEELENFIPTIHHSLMKL